MSEKQESSSDHKKQELSSELKDIRAKRIKCTFSDCGCVWYQQANLAQYKQECPNCHALTQPTVLSGIYTVPGDWNGMIDPNWLKEQWGLSE